MIRPLTKRRLAVSAAAAVALAAFAAPGAAFADSTSAAVTSTIHETLPTATLTVTDTCISNNPLYVMTQSGTALVHQTISASGAINIVADVKEDLTYVPSDPSEPSYTGHGFVNLDYTFPPNVASAGAEYTTTTVLHGSDGSLLRGHVNQHIVVDQQGNITLDQVNVNGGGEPDPYNISSLNFNC